ncbi:unnamed protein product [Ceratitis capitata]|uniref:(Mediterranean fruit fly) hypothetical protein n=1 Tax=Ceratitis capitata TaxID=7213 RepID=A0A811UJR5_CERCA|nr:unnamed protein product [Ceratitis capitata]
MWYFGVKRIILFWTTIIAVMVLMPSIQCNPPKVCPIYCNCDLLNNLNHADCSGKRLISANFDVPYEVESLNLSFNDITILDNNCFQGYVYLLNLTIAHNAIHTIFLDVFTHMKRIRAIDLSHNRLENLDPRLFESNRKLHTLNLAVNKFMILPDEPLLHSKSLRKLNLANSLVNVLLPAHYSALPQLQELDLSNNLIITIDEFAAKTPKRLHALSLEENNLNCDQTLQTALELLKARNVAIEYSNCRAATVDPTDANSISRKFERIELVDEHFHEEAGVAEDDVGDSQEDFDDAIRRGDLAGWHFSIAPDNEDEDYYTDFDVEEHEKNDQPPTSSGNGTINETCRLWCQQYSDNTVYPSSIFNGGFNSSAKLYTDFDLLFVFICGIAVGIALTIFIGSCIICIWRCSSLQASSPGIEDPYDMHYAAPVQTRQRSVAQHLPSHAQVDAIRRQSAHDAQPEQAELLPIAAPLPPRRRQRRAPSTQRAVVRHDQLARAGGDNFISRLFGRPARHQYYRTINENTATLIRHLSRSNLFRNRQSQHFGERESNNTNQSAPNTPDSVDGASVPNLEDGLEGSTTQRRRPETPPPLYSEIITKNCDRSNAISND